MSGHNGGAVFDVSKMPGKVLSAGELIQARSKAGQVFLFPTRNFSMVTQNPEIGQVTVICGAVNGIVEGTPAQWAFLLDQAFQAMRAGSMLPGRLRQALEK